MTHAKHAERIHKTLRKLHKALDQHHRALAAYAAEHGPDCGVSAEIVALAAVPKKPPSNP
jgi:predicted translin family RNA/ssDNA-binding protein